MTHHLMNSYAAGPTEVPLLEETIFENFARAVTAYPHNIALIDAHDRRQ